MASFWVQARSSLAASLASPIAADMFSNLPESTHSLPMRLAMVARVFSNSVTVPRAA